MALILLAFKQHVFLIYFLLTPDTNKINDILIENLILDEDEKHFLKHTTKKDALGFKTESLVAFQTILLSYLDFKQKENTAKAKKIKDMQENLPVFTFKYVLNKLFIDY